MPAHLPVLVGAAAVDQRPERPGEGVSCVDLMARAAAEAIDDAGGRDLAATIDEVLVTRGLSRYVDAAGRVAAAVGAPAARTKSYEVGIPQQTLINRAVAAIRTGSARSVLVVGGETKRRDDLARRAGVELDGPPEFAGREDELVVAEGEIVARPEVELGVVAPVHQYAMIDSSRRPVHGWTIDEHRADIASLWASFNEVARGNPKAAFGEPMSMAEIRDPSESNREIAFPYNKWHNSQWSVDQAAALLFISADSAAACGVDPQRFVFPQVALESSQSVSLSRRAEMHRWPAMGVLGEAAAAHLDRPIHSFEHVELYSCFPAAVRVQQAELGLDPSAPATLTGGMSFAGGPFNNFVFQATVAMVDRLRESADDVGLVTVVSGLLTKPGLTVWSREEHPAGPLVGDLVDRAREVTETEPLDEDPDDAGSVATYTVVGDRVVAIIDLDSGARAVAAREDPRAAAAARAEDLIGTPVAVRGRTFEI